ncbi:MAG: SDR family oxidoreductase [Acidobacteriota bacterium]
MTHKDLNAVTGGAGFIGSHLATALLQRGSRVRIIDNFSTGHRENTQDLAEEFADHLEVIDADIRDLDALRDLFSGAGVVYHQAAIASVQRSVRDPLESNSANVEGTLKVLLAARDAGVRKVVFAASSSVYGDSEVLPKHEEMKPNPISPYALTKYVGELYCQVFSDIYELPAIGLRYFNVFGPRQDPKSEYAAVIPRFITRMLRGERPIIFGDGEQSRDFTYIDNVVSANLIAASSEVRGLSLNVACGERFSLNQVVSMLNEILGTRLQPLYQAARLGDVRHSQADIRLAVEKMGFKPLILFREGLRRTAEWFARREKRAMAGEPVQRLYGSKEQD